jgi:hypothetical protein
VCVSMLVSAAASRHVSTASSFRTVSMEIKASVNTVPFGAELAPERVVQPKICPWTRPEVRGKFLWVGTFIFVGPGKSFIRRLASHVVEDDFAKMADNGVNAVRT